MVPEHRETLALNQCLQCVPLSKTVRSIAQCNYAFVNDSHNKQHRPVGLFNGWHFVLCEVRNGCVKGEELRISVGSMLWDY